MNNKRCLGCGLILSTDKNNICYTPDFTKDYCVRCWNLKHYQTNNNALSATKIANESVNELKIDPNKSVIFLVNDLLNINFNLIEQYKNYPYVVYVFNKIDLVLNDKNKEIIYNNLINLLASLKISDPKIILASVKNHHGIKLINDFIADNERSYKYFFIGDTNAGKTSIIQQLLMINKKKNATNLIISPFLNTSLIYKKYKINQHDIIDAPGFNDASNLLNYLDQDQKLNNLFKLKKANQVHYLIKKEQSFIFDKFGYITIIPKDNCYVSFNLSLNVEIKRSKPDKIIENFNQINSQFKFATDEFTNSEFNVNSDKVTLQICGLGQIRIKGASKILVNTYKNIKIDVIDQFIC